MKLILEFKAVRLIRPLQKYRKILLLFFHFFPFFPIHMNSKIRTILHLLCYFCNDQKMEMSAAFRIFHQNEEKRMFCFPPIFLSNGRPKKTKIVVNK